MSYSVQMDFRDTSACLLKILIYVNGFSFFQGIVLWGWGGKNVYLFIYLNWKVVDELLMFSQFFFSWSKLSHRSYSLDGFLDDVHENVLECIKRSFKKWYLNEKKDNFRIRTFDRLHVTKCIWAIDDIFL